MTDSDRELWMQMRRALLLMVRAIEEHCETKPAREPTALRR